jgi:hypothetical protein
MITTKAWSVWVGGSEVTDYYITDYLTAHNIYHSWIDKGYTDVHLEEISQ